MTVIAEIYQFLFISSIIFILHILGNLGLKMYGRFALKQITVVFEVTKAEKIMLWISLTTFLSYLIN